MRPTNWAELGQNEEVEFDVHCKMKKCWANEFLSLLKDMQRLGEIGSSRFRGMYCDGDGDFRPKFTHTTLTNLLKHRPELTWVKTTDVSGMRGRLWKILSTKTFLNSVILSS